MKKQNIKIKVKGVEVAFVQSKQKDFICITDIAKFKNPSFPRCAWECILTQSN